MIFINAYGLVKYDINKNAFVKVVGTNDRADDNVTSLLLTDNQLIWMNLRHSIMVYNKLTGELISLSSRNGLPVGTFSSQQLYFDESEKKVFAGFANYISVISADAFSYKGSSHRIFITGLQELKKGEYIDFTSDISLGSKKNDLRIDFSIPDFDHLQPLTDYEYRLHPDNAWINTGSLTSLNLNNLHFGQYELQIRQAGIDDLSKMATLKFVIKPSFFQTAWFYILIGLIVSAILYMLYRYRIRQVQKIHSVREKIASDLHDDIGSRLTNIRVLSIIGENETATADERKEYLKKISEEAMSSGEALSEIVFNMKVNDEELEDIAARMRHYAGQVFEGNGTTAFKMKIDATLYSKQLELEKKRDLFMIFKEALNNIHKHASAKNVFIELKVSGDKLIMTIQDNGVGFDTEEFTGKNGLGNIKSRAARWSGEVEVYSKKGGGTTVILKLPFQKTSHIKRILGD